MFPTKVVEKISIHIFCAVTHFENRAICDNVDKCYREGHATLTMERMRIACWIPWPQNPHTQAV